MSILQSIWNGPFHVGKLAQPISVGDVLLKILEVLWRAIISVIALSVCVAVYVTYIHSALFPPLKDNIIAEAFYAADFVAPPPLVQTVTGGSPRVPSVDDMETQPCSKDFPVRITFRNTGSKSVTDVRYQLEGYAPGRSDDYLEYQTSQTSDLILRPGFGFSGCYAARTKDGFDPKMLTYKVDVWSASEVP